MQSVTTTIDNLNSETWFSWSPVGSPTLNTTFTAPVSCATRWIQNPYNTNELWSDYLSLTARGASGESGTITNFDNYVAPGYYANCRPNSTAAAFSPGICTSGQTVAWILERHYQGTTLWVGGCCNRDMTVPSPGANCEKIFSTPMTFVRLENWEWDSGVNVVAADLPTSICSETGAVPDCTDTLLRGLSDMASGTAYAHPFEVYWQSSDLSKFPVDYASSIALMINVPFGNLTTTTSAPASSPVPPTNSSNRSSGLKPGAIAGIAVGVVILVISSVVLGLYFWRRQKQKRLQHTDAAELEGSSRGLKHFVGGKWRAEQDGTAQPVEAGSTSVKIIPGPPVELDSMPAERIR